MHTHTHQKEMGIGAFSMLALAVGVVTISHAFPHTKTPHQPHTFHATTTDTDIPVFDFSAEESHAGVILPGNAHTFVRCHDNGNQIPLISDQSLENHTRFWAYEFTQHDTEDAFHGTFYLSQAELKKNPAYRAINTLQTIKGNTLYYVMSRQDLYFTCAKGIRSALKAHVHKLPLADSEHTVTDIAHPVMRIAVWTDRDMTIRTINLLQTIKEEGGEGYISDTFINDLSLWIDTNGDGNADERIASNTTTDDKNNYNLTVHIEDPDTLFIKRDTSVIIDIRAESFIEGHDISHLKLTIPETQPSTETQEPFITMDDGKNGVSGWFMNDRCFDLQGKDDDPLHHCDGIIEPGEPNIFEVQLGSAACGNAVIEPGEECDDGNRSNGDGCSNDCAEQIGYECAGSPSTCTPIIPNLPKSEEDECKEEGSCTTSPTKTKEDDAEHDTIRSRISSITNANPDPDGTAIPTGTAPIGQFRFAVTPSDEGHSVTFDQLILNVDAKNVVLKAADFALYNKEESNVRVPCQIYYLNGNPFDTNDRSAEISGNFLVWCSDLALHPIKTDIEGEEAVFILEGTIVNTQLDDTSTSTLRISLRDFTDSSKTLSPTGSHVRWIDAKETENVVSDWIDYPESVIHSTTYQH